MSQFDLHRLRGTDQIVCRIQNDLGLETPFILCAPVISNAAWASHVPALHLPIMIGEEPRIIVMSQLASIPARTLGAPIGSAKDQHDAIIRAIDLIVSGF